LIPRMCFRNVTFKVRSAFGRANPWACNNPDINTCDDPVMLETHPRSRCARLARRLRGLRRLRGWHRAVNWIVPPNAGGRFLVRNGSLLFAGDIESYIEREMYLFGDYEGLEIDQFLANIGEAPRRVLLDVGANVGTHSLQFARHFQQVHSFEPNPSLWPAFKRNVSLNQLHNVTLHNVGLGAEDADLPFYSIDSRNHGMGTFLAEEQYDRPLKCVGYSRIAHGDRYLHAHGISHVDAIKIDVQGLESSVLRGLRVTLETPRPAVWFEFGTGTRDSARAGELRDWFPYQVDLFKLTRIKGPLQAVRLAPIVDAPTLGDYVALPIAGNRPGGDANPLAPTVLQTVGQ
jgi:FkbM family methyltransferase